MTFTTTFRTVRTLLFSLLLLFTMSPGTAFAILPVPECYPCDGPGPTPPNCVEVKICVCPLASCDLTGGPVCVTIYTNCLRSAGKHIAAPGPRN
jgi:hypothetical protein